MIYKVFSVYDSAIKSWGIPIFARSEGEIRRSFTDASNNLDSNFCRYPQDFTLFCLGEYDDETAVFVTLECPSRLVAAYEVQMPEVTEALKQTVVDKIVKRQVEKN